MNPFFFRLEVHTFQAMHVLFERMNRSLSFQSGSFGRTRRDVEYKAAIKSISDSEPPGCLLAHDGPFLQFQFDNVVQVLPTRILML